MLQMAIFEQFYFNLLNHVYHYYHVQRKISLGYYRTSDNERFFLLHCVYYVPRIKSSGRPKLHCTSEEIYFDYI